MRSLEKNEVVPRSGPERPDLSIPSGGETSRLPRDYAIGALGAGNGRVAPYRLATETLSLVASGKSVADRFARRGERESAALSAKVALLGSSPSIRVGSPADESEGGVSYLVRLLGQDASFSGEIHLIPGKEGSWLVDSLMLDADIVGSGKEGDSSDFDPLLYKRFL